jgi:diguanylate cyclase (GGDEF)-like protein
VVGAARSSADGSAARVVIVMLAAALVLLAVGQHLFVFEDMLAELADRGRELTDTKAELHEAAITDALTQLYNRRLFDEVSVHHIEHHRRFNLPLALIYIDVDRFKDVNDTLGHAVGDRVLRHVSDYIRRQVREADYVFRLGGDEFVVLISCGAEEAQRKVLELQAGFRATLVDAGLPTALSLSVGIAQVPEGARDLDQAIQQADARMYEDKRRRSVSTGRMTHG